MATVNINASARTDFGKSATRKIRAAGQLPGVIYRAGEDVTHIALSPHELENAFRKTMNRNTLVVLTVDGDTKTCLVHKTQRDPASDALLHIDFYELDMDADIQVQVPVRAEGQAIGMEVGGVLRLINRTLLIRCKPANIPDSIVVDITDVEMDTYVKVSAVSAPEGAEIVADTDFNVLGIVGRRIALEPEVVEEDLEGEEGEEGEEGAEGADGDSEESGE